MENARTDEMPSRVITRASCTAAGASAAMVMMNLSGSTFPSAAVFAFAVSFGVEKSSSFASSMFSPERVTSTLVPACPPIGMSVSRRGAGRQTCCAMEADASHSDAAPARTRTTEGRGMDQWL